MEELKLTWNKPTFLKFYQLKRNLNEKEKLYVNVQKVKTKKWRPQVREEFSLDVVTNPNGDIKGYLIGGFNGNALKQIVGMDIVKGIKASLSWKMQEVKKHDSLQSKFGQATWVDEEFIYIFGGADLALKNTRKFLNY